MVHSTCFTSPAAWRLLLFDAEFEETINCRAADRRSSCRWNRVTEADRCAPDCSRASWCGDFQCTGHLGRHCQWESSASGGEVKSCTPTYWHWDVVTWRKHTTLENGTKQFTVELDVNVNCQTLQLSQQVCSSVTDTLPLQLRLATSELWLGQA